MTLDVNKRLSGLLAEIAQSGRSYAGAANGILQSLSQDKEPIQLPDSVLELLGNSNVPDIVPYTQEDLLVLMDALAKSLLYIQNAPDSDKVDDGEYAKYLKEYRSELSVLTNAQLTSMFTRDAFDALPPLRAYAMAMALSDISADRRLPAAPLWQSVIDNYIKSGE